MPVEAQQVTVHRVEPQKDPVTPGQPRTIPAGEFKAKCLKLMDEVAETREPIIITKFGKPVAQIAPMPSERVELFGAMRGTVLWEGDIISPLGEDAWGWFAEP